MVVRTAHGQARGQADPVSMHPRKRRGPQLLPQVMQLRSLYRQLPAVHHMP